MGMFGYGNFRGAAQPKTPGFASATARQGQLDSAEQARINSLRSKNMLGAGELYNEAMGDKSPIADSIFGPETAPETAGPEATQSMAPQSPYEAMLEGGEAGGAAEVGGAAEAGSAAETGSVLEAVEAAEAAEAAGLVAEGAGTAATAAEAGTAAAGTAEAALAAEAAAAAGTGAATGATAAGAGGLGAAGTAAMTALPPAAIIAALYALSQS